MKKFLVAAGVGALLIVAQTAASAASGAGLLGGTDVAETAPEMAREAAPVATERAVPAAAVRPMMGMDAREAGLGTAMAATGEAGETAPVAMTAVARVPDRLGSSVPSYNASLTRSTTQTTGNCYITTQKRVMGVSIDDTGSRENVTPEECERLRAQSQAQFDPSRVVVTASFAAVVVAAAVVVTEDDSESGS